MFRVLDSDSPISKEEFLQFEEILGKKLPKTMLDFYLKHNGGQPQVSGVITSFLSIPLIHLRK